MGNVKVYGQIVCFDTFFAVIMSDFHESKQQSSRGA